VEFDGGWRLPFGGDGAGGSDEAEFEIAMDVMLETLKMYFTVAQCQAKNASNASSSWRNDADARKRDEMEEMVLGRQDEV
jgi:hypothetical protein